MTSTKQHYTEVCFGYGETHDAIRLMTQDGRLTMEGDDLDMVTAAFFHLLGYTVEPSLKRFQLRKYKNGVTTTITDDRTTVYHPERRREHELHFSLSVTDDRPDELWLHVAATQAKLYMNLWMDKKTTTEFGRRLSEAAGWDVAA